MRDQHEESVKRNGKQPKKSYLAQSIIENREFNLEFNFVKIKSHTLFKGEIIRIYKKN